ncbi:MAG TPA: molybdopterin synthase sulfur carrier subunit [Nitrospiraceae bacterium]|nr:MAG: molybdopterin synthase sulfur carrier subunit [Nitrospirae bacterium GWA2_42_11]OGW55262.1 MAG: molybdopterin synthase sulfur carrier subunit [Nitrospirae bacterium RIFCSPLOWO2_02_42_7]OGW56655.1 MAG: molybdopterin synthase sulfur carrier subunit [Nitrospirae bacterium RIFCSPHIGHO2_02_FULL_42_12]HAS16874.1 molybdopterin synthase sulfur carrier subunit [Nitrospiraceae bacterium]HBI24578.1 molybdopterin synthase sulfur carrier subunit [Nitrospiraceae bacterium]
MMIKVRIPTPLRKLTEGKGEVEGDGKTIGELLDSLESSYPGIKERLCDESGNLRRFVNVYVNEEDIRFIHGKDTSLSDGDEVSIVPAIAGGSGGDYGAF